MQNEKENSLQKNLMSTVLTFFFPRRKYSAMFYKSSKAAHRYLSQAS